MYIDKTYPFEPVSCQNFFLLDSCLGERSLLIHYNEIYIPAIIKLNNLLSKYPSLQKSSLDELIFNNDHINIIEKNDLMFLASKVYNHHVFFKSISGCNTYSNNLPLMGAINKCFGSYENFKIKFIEACMNVTNGFVYLVCDDKLNLSIFVTNNCNTPIPYNLYPLMCIDMWEHSYYLVFNVNKEKYVNNFLNSLNFTHINNEYLECSKCIL